jgi:hypothetical protein
VEHFSYNEPQGERSWEVVYLPRPSGAGLSGGWAGFAKDQVCSGCNGCSGLCVRVISWEEAAGCRGCRKMLSLG